jgi:hypothetical protein
MKPCSVATAHRPETLLTSGFCGSALFTMSVCIVWKWALLSTFRRYMLPPYLVFTWVTGSECESRFWLNRATREAAYYLPDTDDTVHFHPVQIRNRSIRLTLNCQVSLHTLTAISDSCFNIPHTQKAPSSATRGHIMSLWLYDISLVFVWILQVLPSERIPHQNPVYTSFLHIFASYFSQHHSEKAGSRGKAFSFHLGGARFEYLSWHQVSWDVTWWSLLVYANIKTANRMGSRSSYFAYFPVRYSLIIFSLDTV